MSEKEFIIITGSSGFIGSALVDALRRDYTVVGLDRTESAKSAKAMKHMPVVAMK